MVSITVQRAGGSNEVKRQAVAPIPGVVDGVVNRNGERQHISDNHNSYHVEEVKYSDNDFSGFLAVTGWLEQSVNRR